MRCGRARKAEDRGQRMLRQLFFPHSWGKWAPPHQRAGGGRRGAPGEAGAGHEGVTSDNHSPKSLLPSRPVPECEGSPHRLRDSEVGSQKSEVGSRKVGPGSPVGVRGPCNVEDREGTAETCQTQVIEDIKTTSLSSLPDLFR